MTLKRSFLTNGTFSFALVLCLSGALAHADNQDPFGSLSFKAGRYLGKDKDGNNCVVDLSQSDSPVMNMIVGDPASINLNPLELSGGNYTEDGTANGRSPVVGTFKNGVYTLDTRGRSPAPGAVGGGMPQWLNDIYNWFGPRPKASCKDGFDYGILMSLGTTGTGSPWVEIKKDKYGDSYIGRCSGLERIGDIPSYPSKPDINHPDKLVDPIIARRFAGSPNSVAHNQDDVNTLKPAPVPPAPDNFGQNHLQNTAGPPLGTSSGNSLQE